MMHRMKVLARALLPSAVYDQLVPAYWAWLAKRRKKDDTGGAQTEWKNPNTAEYWNGIWAKEGPSTRNSVDLHRAILDVVPEGRKVIDVGCGNGQLIRKLMTERRSVCTALDISEVALQALQTDLGIETVRAVLPAIPVRSETYDVAICSECLEHLDNPKETIVEMHRIVREGGRLIITVPDGCLWKRGYEHVRELTPTDCVNLLRPHVRSVHLSTLVDGSGWPHLVVWGERSGQKPHYADSLAESPYLSTEERTLLQNDSAR